MTRRIKTKKGSAGAETISGRQSFARGIKTRKDLRFNISLVFLIAMLSISAYLFLFFLTENGKAFRDRKSANQASVAVMANPQNSVSTAKNQSLDDPALDFKLTIPSQLGQWMYRIGNVKGLTDDSLSNQFVKIYVAQKPVGSSASFDDCYKDVLTLRKFSTEEWDELEKDCNKGNLIFCEGSGTKINEKDGTVWAYTKSEGCSKEAKANCAYIEKIIGSFKFK